MPVTLRNDLKNGATALLTIECRVSYGEPSLKFINRSWAENVLSASTTGPRLIITTLYAHTHTHNHTCMHTIICSSTSVTGQRQQAAKTRQHYYDSQCTVLRRFNILTTEHVTCSSFTRSHTSSTFVYISLLNYSPSALWHCWLGVRKSIRPIKKFSDWVRAWLSVWSVLQMICIWSSWCHCHPIISCFSKIQNGLPFWCRLTQVVLEKRPLNVCVCVC